MFVPCLGFLWLNCMLSCRGHDYSLLRPLFSPIDIQVEFLYLCWIKDNVILRYASVLLIGDVTSDVIAAILDWY